MTRPRPSPTAASPNPPAPSFAPASSTPIRCPTTTELDAILADYVDGDLGRAGLIAAGHDAATVDRVIRLVDLAEYKRRQSAPGPKISIKAFGRDRRLPITNRFTG